MEFFYIAVDFLLFVAKIEDVVISIGRIRKSFSIKQNKK